MAFQFPDPSVATTVVNQDTGITYQWQDPPGKWVIAVETLDTYCVEQQTSTLEINADGQVEFYTDFEITGDKILTNTVNETVDYIVSYEGNEVRVTDLSDAEKQRIGFVEIRKDKYISQAGPGDSLGSNLTVSQVITMYDIAGVEYECISSERILFGPTGSLGPQGTVSQPLECCHKFIAPVRIGSAYVIISEDPPEKGLVEGLLWFSSKDTEYNLFVYCEDENIWVPASPNVGEQGDGGTASSYYQDTPPIEDPDNPFSNGDLWIDSTDLTGYVWSDNYWAEMSLDGAVGAGEFVKKDGDTMTGSLTMEDAGQIHMINTDLDFQARMDDDGSGTWDPAVDRFLDIESMVPQIIDANGSKSADYSDNFGINFKINAGNTGKNRLKVSNRYGDIVTFKGGTGPQIVFADYEDPSQGGFRPNTNETGLTEGIPIRGIPTPDFDNSPNDIAVNKGYVDQRDEFLQNEIVELAEEIDAIAPSVERGEWTMTLSGSNLNEGDITFYDGTFGNGSPIGIFTQAQSVWFSQKDSAGVPHGFDNVEPGYLLELFVQGEDDFGLFEVVEVHDETGNIQNPYYAIDVNFIRALDATSKADAGDRVRMKTFQAPTGGTADGFVLKTGDTIPCDNSAISFPNTYTDNSLKPGVSSIQAYVKFTSKNTNDNSTQTINIFQPGHINALMTNGKFFSKQDLYGQGLKGFKNDLYTKSTIDVSTDSGYLKHNNDTRLGWHVNGGSLYHTTNIFGWTATHSLAYKPIQFTDISTNTDDNHAIHKGYVDDKIKELLAKIEEFEMAGGVPRNYHFEQVQVKEGYNWNGYANALWLWGDEWDQSSTQPGTSSRKLQIQLPNNSDGSPRWLIKPQGHIIINDFEQYYDQRKVGSIIFYPGKIEVKEYAKSYGPQTYYEITGDFAPTASQYSKYWSREAKVRMTFVGGSVEEVPTP